MYASMMEVLPTFGLPIKMILDAFSAVLELLVVDAGSSYEELF